MMTNSKFNIRLAEEKDSGTIFKFIQDLAEFEKLSDTVSATEDIIRESLFGQKAYAETILAEIDGKPVAFAMFFHNFSTFVGRPGLYIEDAYVYPEHRGKGIGTCMFKFCAKLAKERNCGRMEWMALKWNPACELYKKMGAETMDEWHVFRLTGDALDEFAG
ncbi:MAG: GNAT family N-acetyltransferase [Candidatus Kapabacteria bacterium]|jgi:GNAT superfamily N-acetyltransferase|nr:GNAT family N-acetyltransferase [Candidatus Kapabacteria bacterium]